MTFLDNKENNSQKLHHVSETDVLWPHNKHRSILQGKLMGEVGVWLLEGEPTSTEWLQDRHLGHESAWCRGTNDLFNEQWSAAFNEWLATRGRYIQRCSVMEWCMLKLLFLFILDPNEVANDSVNLFQIASVRYHNDRQWLLKISFMK